MILKFRRLFNQRLKRGPSIPRSAHAASPPDASPRCSARLSVHVARLWFAPSRLIGDKHK